MIEDTTKVACGCPLCRIMDKAEVSEAMHHFRNARKEMLLAVKSLVECCIERLDAKQEACDKTEAQKVNIE